MWNKIIEHPWGTVLLVLAIITIIFLIIYLIKDIKKENAKRRLEASKPPEPTAEEVRETLLKSKIGKHVILYMAKTTEPVVLRTPVFDYTNDMASTRYVAYYTDVIDNKVTSAKTIEGIIEDVNLKAVKVSGIWYLFGIEPEKIYECNIINIE